MVVRIRRYQEGRVRCWCQKPVASTNVEHATSEGRGRRRPHSHAFVRGRTSVRSLGKVR